MAQSLASRVAPFVVALRIVRGRPEAVSGGVDHELFDQGVWLLSRFRDPFVTIRGLPLLGDHASYILGPINDARRQALGLIDPTAPVSAQYNLATHLAHRTSIYGFPNPFTAPNWGFPGDQHQPAEVQRLRYVVVERPLLGEAEAALLDRLRHRCARTRWALRHHRGCGFARVARKRV